MSRLTPVGSSAPPTRRHDLGATHPVVHALQGMSADLAVNWIQELHDYLGAADALTSMVPGDARAESTLRGALAFVTRAGNHLASERCSCRLASWVHASHLDLHREAQRLLGDGQHVVNAPAWEPMS